MGQSQRLKVLENNSSLSRCPRCGYYLVPAAPARTREWLSYLSVEDLRMLRDMRDRLVQTIAAREAP
jgi:hypothetical protein